ncbi:hypothetical protein Nepgr_016340 [Nepenthes gracilis]|uniref:Uncharacterized protein n=1 Tax=Nepenthes gracilis TaxID=150966 RepID=A0AAD3SPJ4_NEPGR|nr:hypothetical protein Nepgr_016340 [Nepenthes gracilis]
MSLGPKAYTNHWLEQCRILKLKLAKIRDKLIGTGSTNPTGFASGTVAVSSINSFAALQDPEDSCPTNGNLGIDAANVQLVAAQDSTAPSLIANTDALKELSPV